MDEHPALALREKKDASILVAMDLVKRGDADAVVTAGHTGAGMAAAVLRLGRLPGVDRPALAVQMITDSGPDRAARHRRQPRLDRREPRPVRADGRASSPSASWASRGRASRCSRSARRRARATPGSSAPPSCSTRRTSDFEGNVEGKDLDQPPGRRRRVRRGPRQRRRSSSSRASRRSSSTCGATSSPRPSRGRLGVAPDAPGHRPDPRRLRLREGRRLAAAGRQRDGDHHPRPGEAADDRLRLRGGGDDGADAGPGAHRRGARDARAAGEAAATAAARRPPPAEGESHRERPRADRRPARHRRARPARGPRGPGRRCGSAAAGRRGAGCSAAAPVRVRIQRRRRRASGSGSSPGPVRPSGRSPARSGRRSPRPSSACSVSTLRRA